MACNSYHQPLGASALAQILCPHKRRRGFAAWLQEIREMGSLSQVGFRYVNKKIRRVFFCYCSLSCCFVFQKHSGLCGKIRQFNKFSKFLWNVFSLFLFYYLYPTSFNRNSRQLATKDIKDKSNNRKSGGQRREKRKFSSHKS